MKIISEPPKTGEEFTVSWIDSDGNAYARVCRFSKEWEMFEIKDINLNWNSVIGENNTFKGATILVGKGE